MEYEKNIYGYYIEVESLNPNKELHEFKEDAERLYRNFNEKGYLTPTALTFVLRHDGLEVDSYHAWRSDGIDGTASKLQEWSRLEPYYTLELDEWQKSDYINRSIEKYVYKESPEWLDETFKEAMEDHECETMEELYDVFNYFNDESLDEIASYLWEVFYTNDTMYQIDNTLESILGYYGDAMITKVEGDSYYLFFH